MGELIGEGLAPLEEGWEYSLWGSGPRGRGDSGGASSAHTSSIVKWNTEPLPTVDSTHVVPPMSSVSRLEMTSPSPAASTRHSPSATHDDKAQLMSICRNHAPPMESTTSKHNQCKCAHTCIHKHTLPAHRSTLQPKNKQM